MSPKTGKNNLSIRLTESVVFLRGSVDTVVTGRRTTRDAQPAVLRGLLILNLVKPMKISSIDITLEGKAQSAWPEGVGTRKLEVTEEHAIFSASTVYFRAGKAHHHHARRTASVGPGLILDHDDDDDDSSLTDDSPNQHQADSASSSMRQHTMNNSRRRVSMDYHHLRRNDAGLAFWGLQDVPSPPYSPVMPPITHTLSSPLAAPYQAGHGHERAQTQALANPHSALISQRPVQRPRRESWTSTATGGSNSASSNESIRRQESRNTVRSSLDSPGNSYFSRDGPSTHIRSSSASMQTPNIPDLSLSRRVSQEDDTHEPIPAPSVAERSQSRGRPRLHTAFEALTAISNGPGSRSGSNSRTPSILRSTGSRPSTRPGSPVTPYAQLAPPPPTPVTQSSSSFGNSPSPSQTHVSNGLEGAVRPGYERSTTNPESSPARGRDRRHARFSLAAVSNVLLDAVKERVRSNSRTSGQRGRGSTPAASREVSPDGRSSRRPSFSMDRDTERGRSRGRDEVPVPQKEKERSTFEKITEALGLDNGEDDTKKEHGDGWKEFKKGTYTYPISFAIPANSPPTLQCDFGSVSYRLKATVHRPGAFTQRLTATRDVMLIACPGEDDLDESDNIVVQREWDSQMHYLIVISGRAFPIGSSIPLQLTFMPIAKIKIFRVSAVLEERVDYYTQFKRVARTDTIKKFELLSIRHTEKDPIPLLPLATEFASSPLRPYVEAEDDSEAASALMGPGPWAIQHELQLPKSCARMHFTNKHKRSNIGITHTLKIIFRVERGDDLFVDSKTGRRKHFDIVVQTPIHILSCRCNPEWTSLPRYTSFAMEHHAKTQTCPCSQKRPGSTVGVDDINDPPLLSHTHPVHPIAGPSGSTHPPPPPSFSPMQTHAEDVPPPDSSPTPNGHAIPASGLYLDGHALGLDLSRVPSEVPSEAESIYRRNTQFARLIAGEESEIGEAPPTYDSVICTQNAAGALATTTVLPAHR